MKGGDWNVEENQKNVIVFAFHFILYKQLSQLVSISRREVYAASQIAFSTVPLESAQLQCRVSTDRSIFRPRYRTGSNRHPRSNSSNQRSL